MSKDPFRQRKMTLHYRVIVERYPFSNGMVSSSSPVVQSSLCLMGKKLVR